MHRTSSRLLLTLSLLGVGGGARVRAEDSERPLLLRLADEHDDPSRAEAVAAWKALSPADRVAAVRAGLRSDDAALAFAAAAVASPWSLDLDDLHLVGRGLAPHPLARWQPVAAIADAGDRTLLSGSADLAAFWTAMGARDPAVGEFDYDAPHRLLLPADVPGLVPLLETAGATAFRGLVGDLSNEADNEAGDERQADYVRAFRYALARWRAEAKKRPAPRLSDVGPVVKKAGLPADFVELLRATCGPLGQGFDLGRLAGAPAKAGEPKPAAAPEEEGPARWLHRWALRLTPVAEDLGFLRDLVELPRVLPQTRWWAARRVAAAAADQGLLGRAAGRTLHDVLAQQDDAALFAAAELASRGSRADWARLSEPDRSPAGKKRAGVLAMASWLADPVAAREAAWRAIARGELVPELAQDERWFRAYDVGIATRPEDLTWLEGRLRNEGAPVATEAWFVSQVDPEGLDAKEAERLLARWSARVAEVEALDDTWREALAAMEPLAHDGVVAFLRRLATESKDDDVRLAALGVLAKLGDAALADRMLEGDRMLEHFPGRLLGRVRDPRVEAYLRERATSADVEFESAALEGLAVAYGAPEPLAGYFAAITRPHADPGADAWDVAKALVLAKDPIGAILARTAAGPTLGSGAAGLDVSAGLGLTADPRVAERLRAWRDERASGLYWFATACLALGGDAPAGAEWRAFLGEARTFLLDDLQNGTLFTRQGDPAWVDDWVARLDANCCYSWHAHAVLKATFPTLPFDHVAGDAGRARRADEAWFSRHRGTFVWSPILDGWIPGPAK